MLEVSLYSSRICQRARRLCLSTDDKSGQVAPRLCVSTDDKRGHAKRSQAAPRLCLEYGRHERSGGTEACMQTLNSYG